MSEPMDRDFAVAFFAVFFGGEHHIPGDLKAFGQGWAVTVLGELATFDSDALTRLVLMAHEQLVRVSVMPASPRYLRLAIHKRKAEGRMYDRHPSTEKLLADLQAAVSRRTAAREFNAAGRT